MATDLDYHTFPEQYAKLTDKMKKRFMRKPNVSELVNEFIGLAIQCENAEQPSFAGQCYVCAAKCEASVGNDLGEAEHYVTAARQYMKAEIKLVSLEFYDADRENLESAISSYLSAHRKYPEDSMMRTSILMEIANALEQAHRWREAIPYYEQALATLKDDAMKMLCIKKLHNLHLEYDEFDQALEVANKICDSSPHNVIDALVELQISRLLLTVLLQPPDNEVPQSLKQLISDLMNDKDTDLFPVGIDIRLKMKAILMYADELPEHGSPLSRACEDFLPDLSEQQRELACRIANQNFDVDDIY